MGMVSQASEQRKKVESSPSPVKGISQHTGSFENNILTNKYEKNQNFPQLLSDREK